MTFKLNCPNSRQYRPELNKLRNSNPFGMNFVFKLALREVRSGWKRLFFFFICIGVGVGSIVALRSAIQNLNKAVTSEARNLLGADIQVDSTRAFSAEELALISSVVSSSTVRARTETIEASTMVRSSSPGAEGSLMIELKGIEPNFPLLGGFLMSDGKPFDNNLLSHSGAVVAPQLLERLKLDLGDQITIGTTQFQIRGIFGQEPGGSGGFRLGPRVFVERSAIEAAGLSGFGSRARRKLLFETKDGDVDYLVNSLREVLKNTVVNVRSFKDSEQSLGEQFQRAENYLSLTGLVILVLGGIGVANVTRVFIEQKKKTIAVLKCLGGTGLKVTFAYLLQVLTLGLLGSTMGVILARLALFLIKNRFAGNLPPNMSYDLHLGAVIQGMVLGLLITLLFSSLPLLSIRHIKPNMLLRDEAGGRSSRFDYLRFAVAVISVLGLLALVSWQAGSFAVGVSFLGAMAATAGVLYLAAALLIKLLQRSRHLHSFALRQAINGLYRPGNQTRVILMAVGLGVFLVLGVLSLQANLLQEFSFLQHQSLPSMFLIDIQTDQVEGVAKQVQPFTGARPLLIPTVRARIFAINDRRIDFDDPEMRRSRDLLGREYVVTYRPNTESNESIIAGKFWDSSPSPEPEVSIEEGMKGLVGLDVGSRITFDILGRKMNARVTSIRHVDWRNSRTGFLVLFRPGSLESAPQTFVSPINDSLTPDQRARFQRALLDNYPNISVIDVTEIVASVQRILGNITLAVSFVGGLVLFAGILILIGSVAMTKFQRIYETAILKTLGAKRRVLLIILLAEYGILGLIAAIIGSFGATALSYAVARFIFKITWTWTPTIAFAGIGSTIILVVLVGAISSFDILTRKPLPILRTQ